MPVDRGLATDLAEGLGDLYRDVEARLAADLARRLASGIEAPGWAQRKLSAIGKLRRFVAGLLGRLNGVMAEEVGQALVLAYMRGRGEALDELARLQSTHPEWLRAAQLDDPGPRFAEMIAKRNAGLARELAQVKDALPGADALQRLMFSLIAKIQGTHLRILRWDLDAYRTVVARASTDTLIGTKTRLQAAQSAMDQLVSQGITGFTDKAGRNWELASYVEMATRSTVAQASVEGHLDRLKAAGIGLVIVSDHAGECALCRPWEGKVLAVSGPPGPRTIQVPSAVSDELVTVHIAGTLAEAFAAGLMHPNCRHSISAFLPGATRIPTHTADPEGDKARQRLRYLERQVRKHKRLEAGALDKAAAKAQRAKVRVWQGRIRDHVKVTGLIRQSQREQIGVAR